MSNKRIYVVTLLLALVLPILAACGSGGTGAGASTGASTSGTTASTAASIAASEAASTAASEAASTAASETASTGASTEASTSASMAASGEASTSASMGASSEASASAAAASGAASTAAGSGGAVADLDLSKLKVEDGATLRVSTWGNPAEQKVNQDQIKRFNEVFPNVKVEYSPIAENFQTTMKADFSAGTNVDVLYIDSSLYTAFAPNGQLLDLKPFMDQVGVKQTDFLGEMAKLYTTQDNKVYALPKDFGALALFVRDDFAQKAGIDPKSIKTWDDWKNAAQKMTTNGVIGQCIAFEVQRLGALWIEKGVTAIDNGKANLAQPGAVDAYKFWADLYKNKQAAAAKDVGAGWCGEGLGQGKFAMALEGGWLLPVMADQYKDIKYTAIPIPVPTDGKQGTLVFTNGWGAAANTKYPNAAAALVLFLTGPKNQQAVLQTGFAMPTRQSLLNDPYFQQNPNAKVLFEAGQYGKLADLYWGGPAVISDVVKAIDTTATEPVFLSGADPQQALTQANQQVQQVLDSAK